MGAEFGVWREEMISEVIMKWFLMWCREIDWISWAQDGDP
jgi:hypothetical protein